MYRATIVLIVALVTVPLAAAKTSFVIVGDVSIGGFPSNGTVPQAIATFGQPAERLFFGADSCRLTWPSSGVTMETWYPAGDLDPCGPNGRHRLTTVTDPRWKTSKGLAIRDPLRKLRALYPKASKQAPGKWQLTTRPFAGLPLPGLEARLKDGRIVSFTVYAPRSPF